MQQPPSRIADELIIEQAIQCAQQSGWVVAVADCRVQIASALELMQAGTPDTWYVFMTAHPRYNASLQKPMPLGCRIELLEGRLCAVNLYEPSDRQQYLR